MTARPEDWEILGLEPDADIGQVRRAYRHRRSLYEPAALATYNLLDDEEREDMVVRIDEAYERIMGSEPKKALSESPRVEQTTATGESAVEAAESAPDPVAEPGAHLRHQRSIRGFTLPQIAAETKISLPILEWIEEEDFDKLPAPAFVRGHVQQVARELRLPEAEELAKFYMRKMRGGTENTEG
jgi:hypothetical protein